MKYLTEEDLDEYFALLEKEKLTEEENYRKDEILFTAMLARACGGSMSTERAEKKLLKMIFV